MLDDVGDIIFGDQIINHSKEEDMDACEVFVFLLSEICSFYMVGGLKFLSKHWL